MRPIIPRTVSYTHLDVYKRQGIFLGNKVYVSMEEDGIQKYSVANRWRLEPKDMDCLLYTSLEKIVILVVLDFDGLLVFIFTFPFCRRDGQEMCIRDRSTEGGE